MKKLFVMLTALLAVGVFCTTSFAANEVQMTLTSPVIYKVGCEKAGSTTYVFDPNASIASGDWWYMDLPEGITLCKSYDFVIAGRTADHPWVEIDPTDTDFDNVIFNNAQIPSIVQDENTTGGPLQPIVGSDADGALIANGNMAFLVRGNTGSRRVTIYALTDGSTPGATLATDDITKMQIKIFDGESHSLTTLDAQKTCILTDQDGDDRYGEGGETAGDADDVIDGDYNVLAEDGEPYVENTLCINATSLVGQYVYTSYASKSDKFTFTGDSQIAHTGSQASISLASCKGDTTDNIAMVSAQNGTCSFEYDNKPMNGDYCDDVTPFGNRVLIEATTGAFGDIDDKYYLEVEIASPADGVYFGGAATVNAFTASQEECDATGTNLGATWDIFDGSSNITSDFIANDNDCAVGADSMADRIKQSNVMDLDGYDTLWINFAPFVYTNTAVEAGEVVTLDISLSRYPCGEIFNDTLDIGTFVTSCANATSTTLFFPWLPGTAAAGWWGGFVITNIGTTAGTAALTYSDQTGAQATYTTESVAAGAQWVNSVVTADEMTDVSGFDMSLNHSVTAVCGFAARGFAFTGNGEEGTGYLANGTANGVNMW